MFKDAVDRDVALSRPQRYDLSHHATPGPDIRLAVLSVHRGCSRDTEGLTSDG